MEQLKLAVGAHVRVVRGNHTAGAIARTPHRDLRVKMTTATHAVLLAQRACEDAALPVTFALAGRDVVRTFLLDTAAEARLGLASRSRFAYRMPPLTLVFDGGLEALRVPVDDVADAYDLLIARAGAHLAEDDPVRVEFVPRLQKQVAEWNEARALVTDAKEKLDLARQLRAAAIAQWDTTYEEVYGLLIARMGKETAERFFMRRKPPRKATTTEEGGTGEFAASPEVASPTTD
jgi:hypothetical protein